MYRFGYLLVPCCVAVVLTAIVASDDAFWLRRVLALEAFVWVGKISYGIYLWHVPIFRIMAFVGLRGRLQISLGTAASVAVAALSYYTVEAYFHRLKSRYDGEEATRAPIRHGPPAGRRGPAAQRPRGRGPERWSCQSPRAPRCARRPLAATGRGALRTYLEVTMQLGTRV
jgi:peptidoglycan/LPS O-acetylase OafA/YrhL